MHSAEKSSCFILYLIQLIGCIAFSSNMHNNIVFYRQIYTTMAFGEQKSASLSIIIFFREREKGLFISDAQTC